MDQAGPGEVAPGSRQVLEGAGGALVVDLHSARAHGRHRAETRNKALLVHPLEQLQGLEAVAHVVLPEALGLIGA